MKAKGAHSQVDAFDRLCVGCEMIPVTEPVVVLASDLYADLKRRGALVGDADILIAATALANGLAVVTNNEMHFTRFTSLQVVNWLR